jgi:hypothetical protein
MEQNPKVATLQLTRDENDRQFSIFHRFNPEGSDFDCGVPRPFNEFITMAVGRWKIYDFEGSMAPGLARFYSGFGAENEPYLSWERWNVPWRLR